VKTRLSLHGTFREMREFHRGGAEAIPLKATPPSSWRIEQEFSPATWEASPRESLQGLPRSVMASAFRVGSPRSSMALRAGASG
jgi:hypothetical protein